LTDEKLLAVVKNDLSVFSDVEKLVIELAKHPNIRGLKDSSGDPKLVSEVVCSGAR
jgi:dihydrodipicolinate synthase/N-acetylneuraminate lyase